MCFAVSGVLPVVLVIVKDVGDERFMFTPKLVSGTSWCFHITPTVAEAIGSYGQVVTPSMSAFSLSMSFCIIMKS